MKNCSEAARLVSSCCIALFSVSRQIAEADYKTPFSKHRWPTHLTVTRDHRQCRVSLCLRATLLTAHCLPTALYKIHTMPQPRRQSTPTSSKMKKKPKKPTSPNSVMEDEAALAASLLAEVMAGTPRGARELGAKLSLPTPPPPLQELMSRAVLGMKVLHVGSEEECLQPWVELRISLD